MRGSEITVLLKKKKEEKRNAALKVLVRNTCWLHFLISLERKTKKGNGKKKNPDKTEKPIPRNVIKIRGIRRA